MTAKEASVTDPEQRLALEASYRAFENGKRLLRNNQMGLANDLQLDCPSRISEVLLQPLSVSRLLMTTPESLPKTPIAHLEMLS